ARVRLLPRRARMRSPRGPEANGRSSGGDLERHPSAVCVCRATLAARAGVARVTRVVRMVAAALWLGGLLIGTAHDRVLSPPPRVVNGYRVVAADLHVHAYPGDGVLPAWELSREARRRQLDAIALTNHNQMWPSRLAAAVGIAPDVLLIPGEEVTTPGY